MTLDMVWASKVAIEMQEIDEFGDGIVDDVNDTIERLAIVMATMNNFVDFLYRSASVFGDEKWVRCAIGMKILESMTSMMKLLFCEGNA